MTYDLYRTNPELFPPVGDPYIDADDTTQRYADLEDRELAAQLIAEDGAETRGELQPDDRMTCYAHRNYLAVCQIGSDLHANPVTGFNWCREHWQPAWRCCREDLRPAA